MLHVRNDHANVQFRINGVMLPDGVTGFGSILETGLIGSMSLVTGALPAEFGMRTTVSIDITTRADAFNNSGSVSYYGGSRGTIEPSFEYGGTFGGNCPTDGTHGRQGAAVMVDAVFRRRAIFLQRPLSANHRRASKIRCRRSMPSTISPSRKKASRYMSAFVDPYTRLSLITGHRGQHIFRFPTCPVSRLGMMGNPPVTSAFGVTASIRRMLNENQTEFTQYGVLALQRSANGFDGQVSYFTRYNNLHFMPDPVGDLLLNGIASDISRQSYTNGIQGDGSYRDQCGSYACAPASPSAASKAGSTIHRWSSRRPAASPSTRHSRSPTMSPSSAGSPASMHRTNGRSPIS